MNKKLILLYLFLFSFNCILFADVAENIKKEFKTYTTRKTKEVDFDSQDVCDFIERNIIDFQNGDDFIFKPGAVAYLKQVVLSPTTFAVAYRDQSGTNMGKVIIGTIIGTDIIFGDEYVFDDGNINYIDMCKIDETRFAIAYSNAWDGEFGGRVVVGIVSNENEISFTLSGGYSECTYLVQYISVTALSNSQLAIAFQEGYSSGKTCIANINDSFIVIGNAATFNGQSEYISINSIDSQRYLIAYKDRDNSDYGTCRIASVSGFDITFGNEEVFSSAGSTNTIDIEVINSNEFMLAYYAYIPGNSGMFVQIGSVHNDSLLIFGEPASFYGGNSTFIDLQILDESYFAVTYQKASNPYGGNIIAGLYSGLEIQQIYDSYEYNGTATTYINLGVLATSSESINMLLSFNEDSVSGYKGVSILADFEVTATDNNDNYVNDVSNYLIKAYPNPYVYTSNLRTKSITISYSLPVESKVKLEIFDILGRKIRTLVNNQRQVGTINEIWDGTDNSNQEVSSGIFFYRLETEKSVEVNKLVIIK